MDTGNWLNLHCLVSRRPEEVDRFLVDTASSLHQGTDWFFRRYGEPDPRLRLSIRDTGPDVLTRIAILTRLPGHPVCHG